MVHFQDVMKVRLQEAMPDIPLQELKEQRVIQENHDMESKDEQEQIYENQGLELNDGQEHLHENQEVEPNYEQEQLHEKQEEGANENKDNCDEGGAATFVEFQYDEENDVTFQIRNITGTNDTRTQSRFHRFKCFRNVFKRWQFGFGRCSVNNRTFDGSFEENPETNAHYGDNVDSDSGNEGDFQEGIPLVRTRQNHM